MSSRDLTPLIVDLSPRLARASWAALVLIGVVTSAILLPPFAAVIAVVALLVCALSEGWRLGLLGARYRPKQLLCDAAGQWWIVSMDGLRLPALQLPGSRIGARIVWLGWRTERGKYWMALIKPQLSAALWRRLQARLRLLPAAPDPGAAQ